MCFLLLQHHDPAHETLIPELLASHTRMAVKRAAPEFQAEANTIFVLPSSGAISVAGCTIRIEAQPLPRNQMPIDYVFRALAHEHQEDVVGVIFSGTGTDGTLGLAAIRENGGLAIAQTPETAKCDSMPRSAIESGAVDYIASPDQIPERIVDYIRFLDTVAERKGAEGLQKEAATCLPEIFPLLQRATGHDFSRYKQSTLVRRVQRRTQILQFDSVGKYVDRLRADSSEAENLFKDLLIGVTQFFRDPEAFEAIAQRVIPELTANASKEKKIRVWAPGCATGEEAYSLAILFAEHASRTKTAPNVQIFATDLDAESLDVARKARYPEHIAEQVSPERLARYFIKSEDGYEVVPHLRELVIFSPHNLIKDPPFSRLDLISCRNLLIYLEADLQRRLLPLFHYALNPAGYLFLGPADNIASRTELFHILDKQNRIFQRKPGLLHSPPDLPMFDSGRMSRFVPAAPIVAFSSKEQGAVRTIERVLLEEYTPACVVINEQAEVLYYSGHTSKYLEHQAGAPSNKLVNMTRKSLRLELRTALHKAISTRKEVVRQSLAVPIGADVQYINLVVRPLTEIGKGSGLWIVVFQELVPGTATGRPPVDVAEQDHPLVQQLENELRMTRDDLQTTIEELETSNEELKSANEELLSMNEELQSTNEELQTSKEELQSLNEELQRKVEEADAANTSLENFFQAAQVPTLFVDRALRVKKFTPAMAQLFPMAGRDIGRDVADIAPHIFTADLLSEVENVIRSNKTAQRQISLDQGRWFLARSTPFRASDESTQGAVITFVDIAYVKRSQEERAKLAAIVDSSGDAIIGKSIEGMITSWNPGAEKMYGYTKDQAVGRPISILSPPDRLAEIQALFLRVGQGEAVESFETERVARDGRRLFVSLTLSPIRDDSGRIVGVSGIDRDITESKRAVEQQARLAKIVETSNDAIVGMTLDGAVTSWNQAAERIFGFTAQEMVGRSILMIIPPEKREEEFWLLDRLHKGETIVHYETVRVRKDGGRIHVSLTNSPIRDPAGRILGSSKIARDITAQKRAETELREAHEKLERHAQELESVVAQRTANLQGTIESLEALCYTIAHDLRAPLRATQGFTQVLLSDYAAAFDAEGKALAERIIAATRRMDALINDLLSYARLTHGELPISPVDLNVETKRVLETLAPEIESRKAQVSVAHLPRVKANETVLGQIFGNLIGNALKFVPPGQSPRIEIWAETTTGPNTRIFVRDHGIGIPPDQREKIFTLFQRLNRDQYPGTGVGLAIVKKGVERLGGAIKLDSSCRDGACFVVELPLAD